MLPRQVWVESSCQTFSSEFSAFVYTFWQAFSSNLSLVKYNYFPFPEFVSHIRSIACLTCPKSEKHEPQCLNVCALCTTMQPRLAVNQKLSDLVEVTWQRELGDQRVLAGSVTRTVSPAGLQSQSIPTMQSNFKHRFFKNKNSRQLTCKVLLDMLISICY